MRRLTRWKLPVSGERVIVFEDEVLALERDFECVGSVYVVRDAATGVYSRVPPDDVDVVAERKQGQPS